VKQTRWLALATLLAIALPVMLHSSFPTAVLPIASANDKSLHDTQTEAAFDAQNHWFTDDFADGAIDPELWQVSGDGVSESEGVMNVHRDTAEASLSTVSDYDGDYEIVVDIKLTQIAWQDSLHGIAVKDASNHGLSFGFCKCGSLYIVQHDGAVDHFRFYGPYKMNQWYQVRLVRSGESMDIYMDGAWIAGASVPGNSQVSFPGYYSDRGAGSGSQSQIDNLEISSGHRPEVTFSSATYTVAEDTAKGEAAISVTLSQASPLTVTVHYETIEDNATAGADYVSSSGTLTFPPGEIHDTFIVPILDDSELEGYESLRLVLHNPDRAALGWPQNAVLTIVDDEQLQVISTGPAPRQLHVPASINISSTFNMEVDVSTLETAPLILTGSQSGTHTGTVHYDPAMRTAIIDPDVDFVTGEQVTAQWTKYVRAPSGVELIPFSWDFMAEVTHPSAGAFGDQLEFAVGQQPIGLYAGDLDGDRDIDLAVTSRHWPDPGTIAVLLNSGDGTLAIPVHYTLAAADPIALFGADLDEDGDIDLAIAHNEPDPSHLTILKNHGNATFAPHGTYVSGVLGREISGGDLDGDGDVDLVMTDGSGTVRNVRVWFNVGDAKYTGPKVYDAECGAAGIVVADVDNDRDRDILLANSNNGRISILLNDGDGNFAYHRGYPAGDGPYGICAHDLNGDGWVDLATANISSGDVTVLLNDGNGMFSRPDSYPCDIFTNYVTGGDFDGDGDIDLSASAKWGDRVWIMLNRGNGTFDPPLAYPAGDDPMWVQAADLDLDGDLDLACANYGSGKVSTLFNISPAEQLYLPLVLRL